MYLVCYWQRAQFSQKSIVNFRAAMAARTHVAIPCYYDFTAVTIRAVTCLRVVRATIGINTLIEHVKEICKRQPIK